MPIYNLVSTGRMTATLMTLSIRRWTSCRMYNCLSTARPSSALLTPINSAAAIHQALTIAFELGADTDLLHRRSVFHLESVPQN
jgi:hypothetical protein